MPKPSVIENLQQFDNTLREMATLDVRIAENELVRKDEIIAAEAKYTANAGALVGRRELLFGELERYYRAHRTELEADGKKSITLQFGSAGIRKHGAELRLLKEWTWDEVVNTLLEGGMVDLVRTKAEVDKEAVKAADVDADILANWGLKLHQKQTFWVEPAPGEANVTTEAK